MMKNSRVPALLLAISLITTSLPAAFAAGGLSRPWGPVLAVGVYDLSSKILSLGMSWLTLRESPGMLVPVAIIVALGYAGSFMGLFSGVRAVRELRHAGIVRS